MHVRPLHMAGTAASAGFLVLALAAPATAQVCDAYSGSCTGVLPTTQGTGSTGGNGAGNGGNGSGTGSNGSGTGSTTAVRGSGGASLPTTLPFTGGELVLVSLAGAGALAAGTGLVVAGRRRTAPQA